MIWTRVCSGPAAGEGVDTPCTLVEFLGLSASRYLIPVPLPHSTRELHRRVKFVHHQYPPLSHRGGQYVDVRTWCSLTHGTTHLLPISCAKRRLRDPGTRDDAQACVYKCPIVRIDCQPALWGQLATPREGNDSFTPRSTDQLSARAIVTITLATPTNG